MIKLLYLNHDIAFPSPTLTKADDGAVHGAIKLGKIVMLQELKREGFSISAIARRTGLERKTVR